MTEKLIEFCTTPESTNSYTRSATEAVGKSICILSQTHLCRNPRVWKEALALYEAGYSVTILTTLYDDQSYEEDLQLIQNSGIRYKCYADLRTSNKNTLKKLCLRSFRKLGVWLTKNSISDSPLSLGYGYIALYKQALSEEANLYICHQEMASCIGVKLLKMGKKVAFDIEDWYSEDLLPGARKNRPIHLLKKTEKSALSQADAVWTTSEAMADAMADAYQTSRPSVIYNSFPKVELPNPPIYKDRCDLTKTSFFWFSQTIGPGRGLENLMNALNHVEYPFELHLRGNISPNYRQYLSDIFPVGEDQTLHIHPLVSNAELSARIAEHDIGLALEDDQPANKNFTVSNKLFQYLESGLAVVASSTVGQQEIANKVPKAIIVFEDTNSLSDIINQFLADRELLQSARKQAREMAPQCLTWEIDKEKLLGIVDSTLLK